MVFALNIGSIVFPAMEIDVFVYVLVLFPIFKEEAARIKLF